MMNIPLTRVAVVCGLGLAGVIGLHVPLPERDSSSTFASLVEPLRALQREAIAQESGSDVSPSDVFQLTSDLQSEIEILREAMGILDYPLEAELEDDRSPIHEYARSLELRRKISRLQSRLGMSPAPVPQIPVKEIRQKDVLESVQVAMVELVRIKDQLVIEDKIQPAPLVGGKTPTLVYQALGDASYMMDGLVGRPTDMNDVFGNLILLQGDMELVAAKLKVALQLDPPLVEDRKRLTDVAQQLLRSTFKVVNLQTRLGMDASGVPQITLVRVAPSNLYEAINILNAEMVRIKVHLNVKLPRETQVSAARNKKPRDVFAEVLRLIRNLDLLAKAADNYLES